MARGPSYGEYDFGAKKLFFVKELPDGRSTFVAITDPVGSTVHRSFRQSFQASDDFTFARL